MARMLKEQKDKREISTEFDGTISETRYFRISIPAWEWLHEHGQLAAISLADKPGIISVAAFIDECGKWNGWAWIHDEFGNSELNPKEWNT